MEIIKRRRYTVSQRHEPIIYRHELDAVKRIYKALTASEESVTNVMFQFNHLRFHMEYVDDNTPDNYRFEYDDILYTGPIIYLDTNTELEHWPHDNDNTPTRSDHICAVIPYDGTLYDPWYFIHAFNPNEDWTEENDESYTDVKSFSSFNAWIDWVSESLNESGCLKTDATEE